MNHYYKNIHNPRGVKVGDKVILDKGTITENVVIVLSMTPNQIFSRVFDEDGDPEKDSWEVMTNRLSNFFKLNIMENLTFGAALEAAKAGAAIQRSGWNGKGMFVAYSPGKVNILAEDLWGPANTKWASENGGSCDVEPCLTIKTAQNTISNGWRPTSADILASDWQILE